MKNEFCSNSHRIHIFALFKVFGAEILQENTTALYTGQQMTCSFSVLFMKFGYSSYFLM